ncbi:RadC-like JAB domain-containing protein [Mariniflexile fucanivorans]|uniref:RadC-like JAB domain-containing protein n=2 Tax=Mariniflexile fucanivorans TaxID=264023 RepID=A0A4R1RA88_9FLAO|nr:JAB domain-containing protein [Mariniflexile fucanivorans]TCL62510.1 RadC-like JAB domain-containing protein [Mariniflexile fucanivorans]
MKELKRISTFKNFVGELTATYKRTSLPSVSIRSSKDIASFIRPYFEDCMDDHEEVKVIHLNRTNSVVNVHHHTIGGLTGSLVDVPLVLRDALLIQTSCLIMVHNHPSGGLKPSEADLKISKRLKEACEIIGISFLDSIIITRESYCSLADDGLL